MRFTSPPLSRGIEINGATPATLLLVPNPDGKWNRSGGNKIFRPPVQVVVLYIGYRGSRSVAHVCRRPGGSRGLKLPLLINGRIDRLRKSDARHLLQMEASLLDGCFNFESIRCRERGIFFLFVCRLVKWATLLRKNVIKYGGLGRLKCGVCRAWREKGARFKWKNLNRHNPSLHIFLNTFLFIASLFLIFVLFTFSKNSSSVLFRFRIFDVVKLTINFLLCHV